MNNSLKPKKISPYFNFCTQHRQKIKAQLNQSGQPTSAPALTKALSALWRSLSDTEKQAYNQPLNEAVTDDPAEASGIGHVRSENLHGEKGSDCTLNEQLNFAEVTHLEVQKNEGEETAESAAASQGEQRDELSHVIKESSAEDQGIHQQPEENVPAFPLARVKRIIKLDKDIRLVSSDALTLITQATQLFLEHFAGTTYAAALQKKHKSVRLEDIKLAIKNERRVEDFLGDALKDLFSNEKEGPENDSGSDDDDDDEAEKASKVQSSAIKHNESNKKKAAKKKKNPTPPPGSRRIMDFFGNKVCSAAIPGTALASD